MNEYFETALDGVKTIVEALVSGTRAIADVIAMGFFAIILFPFYLIGKNRGT